VSCFEGASIKTEMNTAISLFGGLNLYAYDDYGKAQAVGPGG